MVKVGDRLRILRDIPNNSGFLKGEEVEVIRFKGTASSHFECKRSASSVVSWCLAANMEGTDFEVIGAQGALATTSQGAGGLGWTSAGGAMTLFGGGGGGGWGAGDTKWDKGFEIKLKKCECGKEKHGFASHSQWCDIKD